MFYNINCLLSSVFDYSFFAQLAVGHNYRLSFCNLISIPASFGSGNNAPASFPNNKKKEHGLRTSTRYFCKNLRSMKIIACKLQKFSAHKHPLKLKSMLNVSLNKIYKLILQQLSNIKSPSLSMGKHESWSNMLPDNKNIDNFSHQRIKPKY